MIDNLKYEKETFTAIAEMLTLNTSLQKLVIRNAQAPSSFWVTLSENLKVNENSSLQFFDFSGNHMEVSAFYFFLF